MSDKLLTTATTSLATRFQEALDACEGSAVHCETPAARKVHFEPTITTTPVCVVPTITTAAAVVSDGVLTPKKSWLSKGLLGGALTIVAIAAFLAVALYIRKHFIRPLFTGGCGKQLSNQAPVIPAFAKRRGVSFSEPLQQQEPKKQGQQSQQSQQSQQFQSQQSQQSPPSQQSQQSQQDQQDQQVQQFQQFQQSQQSQQSQQQQNPKYRKRVAATRGSGGVTTAAPLRPAQREPKRQELLEERQRKEEALPPPESDYSEEEEDDPLFEPL
jgi:hypothetical protein